MSSLGDMYGTIMVYVVSCGLNVLCQIVTCASLWLFHVLEIVGGRSEPLPLPLLGSLG